MNDLAPMIGMAKQFLSDIGSQPKGNLGLWAMRAEALSSSLPAVRAIRTDNRDNLSAMGRRGSRVERGSFVTRVGSVALIPLIGPLSARYSWSYFSYDELASDLQMVASMDDITAAVLDIDCPGGVCSNIEVATDAIRAFAEQKPISAHINGIGASAAYWLAAATGNITASRSAMVGSVGSLISYLDIEGIFTGLGAKKVEVLAEQSPNKRLDPDSDEGKAELQALVDDAGEQFVQSLMLDRGVSRETILDEYGQGLVFHAGEAFDRGMVDEILSMESLITQLAERGSVGNAATATAPVDQKETTMTDKNTGGQANLADLTIESLEAERPDLVESIQSAARDGVADAAAKAERDRILGIEEHSMPGHEDLVAELKADGKTTPADAAVKILQAEKSAAATRVEGLKQLDQAAEGLESSSSQSGEAISQVPQNPEGWRAEWEASDELQKQHLTADAYIAEKRRETK